MKVLSIVSYQFLPAKMGGQKHIALHNSYLSKLVSLSCITTKSNVSTEAPYLVRAILSNSVFRYINLFYFFIIRRIIQQEKITHIILEHPYWGWLGFLLQRFCNVKLIIHTHNIEANRFKSLNKWWWKILWHYEKCIHQQADYSLFITEEDRNFAIQHYQISKLKSAVSTYGIEIDKLPSLEEKLQAKLYIQTKYSIQANEKILLFNGSLNYTPNLNALDNIVKHINPFLIKDLKNQYKILVCGKGLSESFTQQEYPNIIFCGMVDDISVYFKAADIFINPVMDGGGIKTKIVEALAYNTTVISTQSGAFGIPETIVNGKLLIVNDSDWDKFSQSILEVEKDLQTPEVFYRHFYWGNIAAKTYQILQEI